MNLIRYSVQELTDINKRIFYNYMTQSDKFFACFYETLRSGYKPIDKVHLYLNLMRNGYLDEQNEYLCALVKEKDNEIIFNIKRKLSVLSKKINDSVIEVTIPLNKRINSYYDDFYLKILYSYKDYSPTSFYSHYKNLSSQDRESFFNEQAEIIGMFLLHVEGNRSFPLLSRSFIIELIGKGDLNKIPNCLCSKFAGFDKLSLSDIMKINNNDIRQILQSKIDLDKENLQLLANVNIRGDNYLIFRKNGVLNSYLDTDLSKNIYFIRYVCSSTKRVYYNELNLSNLNVSPYFKYNVYETYAKAWWNITHMGAKCEGAKVLSC